MSVCLSVCNNNNIIIKNSSLTKLSIHFSRHISTDHSSKQQQQQQQQQDTHNSNTHDFLKKKRETFKLEYTILTKSTVPASSSTFQSATARLRRR